jgi:hypothetical protein
MSEEIDRQAVIDEEHLKLLSFGYVITAAMTAFVALFVLLYVTLGVSVVTIIAHKPLVAGNPGQAIPAAIGWIIAGVGLGVFLIVAAFAAAKLRVAFCIKKRKSRTFCMVIAAICCLGVPYGTVLGVLTFMVLGRASVVRMFQANNESGVAP